MWELAVKAGAGGTCSMYSHLHSPRPFFTTHRYTASAWHRFFPGGQVCPPLHLISGLIILFSVEECSPLRNIFWGAKRGLPIPRRLPDPALGMVELSLLPPWAK